MGCFVVVIMLSYLDFSEWILNCCKDVENANNKKKNYNNLLSCKLLLLFFCVNFFFFFLNYFVDKKNTWFSVSH